MAAILETRYLEFPSRNFLSGCRRWSVAAFLAMAAATSGAQAQNVVAFVNGEPITALDIDQRSKLLEATSPTHKVPSRQEVLDDLINEKLEIREAKRWGIEASGDDVDQAFTGTAQKFHVTTDQFIQMLTKSGVTPQTYRARLRAQIVWPSLVRGRYSSSLEIFDKDILQEMLNKKTDEEAGNYDYTLRPILFIVPPGSPASAFEDRKREAEGLRGRFTGCEQGLSFARGLASVVVRDQIIRGSADIPPDLRKGLDSVPVGQLTAPEITKLGVEMFAVCAKDAAKADNSPDKRQARESLFNQKFEQQSKKYLQELHRQALIEYPSGNGK
ncbi:MAG TPA: SurA N-terminal domain-containing protein [Xanthobacteraceae bacterium]